MLIHFIFFGPRRPVPPPPFPLPPLLIYIQQVKFPNDVYVHSLPSDRICFAFRLPTSSCRSCNFFLPLFRFGTFKIIVSPFGVVFCILLLYFSWAVVIGSYKLSENFVICSLFFFSYSNLIFVEMK